MKKVVMTLLMLVAMSSLILAQDYGNGQIYAGPGMMNQVYNGPGMNKFYGTGGNNGGGHDHNVYFKAVLTGDNQVPSVNTSAMGMGTFVLNAKANTLTYNINYTDLSSNETMAHFHGPAMSGYSAPPVFTLPMGDMKAGVWHYDPKMEKSILNGKIYVNVHSEMFPNGEIRGQLMRV